MPRKNWVKRERKRFSQLEKLSRITQEFPFIESSHDGQVYKIRNQYVKYGEHKILLGSVSIGIEAAIDIAINKLTEEEEKFERNLS